MLARTVAYQAVSPQPNLLNVVSVAKTVLVGLAVVVIQDLKKQNVIATALRKARKLSEKYFLRLSFSLNRYQDCLASSRFLFQ